MAALVLDVGSWFRAQRDTQAAADASALAAAQALPDEPGTASALAGEYVDKNGGGARTITFTSKNVANDTVSVRVERPTPGFFARVFGVNSVQVGAKATARASGAREGAVGGADHGQHQSSQAELRHERHAAPACALLRRGRPSSI